MRQEVCVLCLSVAHTALEQMHRTLYGASEFPAWHYLQGGIRPDRVDRKEANKTQ